MGNQETGLEVNIHITADLVGVLLFWITACIIRESEWWADAAEVDNSGIRAGSRVSYWLWGFSYDENETGSGEKAYHTRDAAIWEISARLYNLTNRDRYIVVVYVLLLQQRSWQAVIYVCLYYNITLVAWHHLLFTSPWIVCMTRDTEAAFWFLFVPLQEAHVSLSWP